MHSTEFVSFIPEVKFYQRHKRQNLDVPDNGICEAQEARARVCLFSLKKIPPINSQ